MDARTSVAKDLAQISRQDNAAMWSSPNPDSPEIPSSLFPSFPSRNDKMPCKFILLKQTKQPIDRLSDYSGYSLYFFYSKQ